MATGKKIKKIVRTASGRKRARQSLRENARNSSLHSRMRTSIKTVRKAIVEGRQEGIGDLYLQAQRIIDITADKNIVHKNKAARDKSRLVAAIRTMKDRMVAGVGAGRATA